MWQARKMKTAWPIGVELCSDGVRMLQYRENDSRFVAVGGAQWLAGAATRGSGMSRAHVDWAIEEMMRNGHFNGHQVVTSIATDDVDIATILVQESTPEELPYALMAKAHEAFKFDLSLARLSVLPAGPLIRERENGQVFILMAVPLEKLNLRQQALEGMGLSVVGAEPEPISLYRAYRRLRRRSEDRNIAQGLIHLTDHSCLVIVATSHRVLLVRTIHHGEETLDHEVSQALGLSVDDAHQLRRYVAEEWARRTRNRKPDLATGRQPQVETDTLLWSVHDAVREKVDSIVLEIGLCLRYCMTTFGCPAIQNVTLSGPNAWDPTLHRLLTDRLGVTTDCLWPLRDVDLSQCPIFVDRRGMMSEWSVGAGLAAWAESEEPIDQADTLLKCSAEVDVEGGTF